MLLRFFDWLRDRRRRAIWTPGQAVGRRGEDLAHRYLRDRGYTIVARNWRLPSGNGEADLIAWDGDDLAIVEVKTRESEAYGPPDRAIDPDKIESLARIARAWIRYRPNTRVRADLVTVVLGARPALNLYQDAVDLPLVPVRRSVIL